MNNLLNYRYRGTFLLSVALSRYASRKFRLHRPQSHHTYDVLGSWDGNDQDGGRPSGGSTPPLPLRRRAQCLLRRCLATCYVGSHVSTRSARSLPSAILAYTAGSTWCLGFTAYESFDVISDGRGNTDVCLQIIDNMQFHSEGGLELLSRFSAKPRAINLDNVLFAADVDNRSIVEIVGASSTGKTVLLCQFIARCILPAQYKGIKLGGCDACAILIDTLGHVQVSKIAELMACAVHDSYREATVQPPPTEMVDRIVNKSLENLTVISCCNNDQLQLTLRTLEDEFLDNERIALLAIDNILAYYWQARRDSLFSMDHYTRELVKIIQAQTLQFHTMTIYTRWDGPVPRYANPLKGTGVNYRLQLSRSNVPPKFICRVQSTNNIKQMCYMISDSGIKWIP